MAGLPILLTFLRLIAAPIVAFLILWGDGLAFSAGVEAAGRYYAAAFVLFVLAALTDALDGWLARRWNAVTAIGAALDHAADKALTACTLVALAVTALASDLVYAVIIILARDVAIAGLREGLSLSGKALPVGPAGKVKTVAVLIGAGAALLFQTMILLRAPYDWALPVDMLARGAIWGGAALALWSGWDYLRAAFVKDAKAPAE